MLGKTSAKKNLHRKVAIIGKKVGMGANLAPEVRVFFPSGV